MRRLHLCRSTATLMLGVAIALTGCSYAKDKNTRSTEDKKTEIAKTEMITGETSAEEAADVTVKSDDNVITGNAIENTAENTGENTTDSIAENTGENTTEDIAENTDENTTEDIAENAGENSTENTAENTAELFTSEMTYDESVFTAQGDINPGTEQQTSETDVNTFYDNDMAWQILELVNEERVRLGLSPLTMSYSLQKASDIRAREIAVSFSHTRPDGSSCITAISQAGISFGYVGENIAVGYYSAEAVMKAWINSEGHYANIINPNYTRIAVSCYYDPESYGGYNWVQLFISD